MFTDDDRRELYGALEQSLGQHPAAILMAHLAPVGWVDLATKGDIAELRGEIAQLRASMLPKLIAANIASMIGVAGLVLAASSLG
jgi:uncharacterized membrane protein